MSPNSNASGEELVDRLLGTLVESSFDQGKEFWPDNCIKEIVTPETITDKLAEQNDQVPRELVTFINRKCRKTFAIVLCCNIDGAKLFQAMKSFMRHDFNDSKLPVDENGAKHIFYSSNGKCQYPWNPLAVRSFADYQWRALAPRFNSWPQELALHRDHIFPFTSSNHRGGSGMFGDVYEVEIHPAHWCQGANVAVKKLHRVPVKDPGKINELEKEWEKEVQAHKTIAQCNHPNIIKFMTAISRDHERYLMFEWANGGNLREFWVGDSPPLTKHFVKDILLQLQGLADALEEIHAKKLRHGDMKPENILRFKKQGDDSAIGTLKICDMGLTKYHELATQLRAQATDTKFTTSRYEPPESAEDNKAWSRRYDTWSMGCIILEFIVWMVYGTETLGKFNKKIVNEVGKSCHYFEMQKRNGEVSSRVHQAVCGMMDGLAREPECQKGETALGDLLELVKTRLLVIERADSMTLNSKLKDIIGRGEQNPTYWVKGKTSDDLPSLCTPRALDSEDLPRDFLAVAKKGSTGNVGGLLNLRSSSLVVPVLTGSIGVG